MYRQALLLFCCSCLWSADTSQLRDLAKRHRFFDLRRALEQPGWNANETVFYRGMIASRFGNEAEGIDLLRNFVATTSDSYLLLAAWEEIAAASRRLGHYGKAAQAQDEVLKLTPANDPDRAGIENDRLLVDSLRDVAPVTADPGAETPGRAVRNPLGSWNVPVAVNGVAGDWIFDTGANMTTVTESEAKRMGLTVGESKAWVSGSTGKHNALRLTVAKDLVFAGAHVHNVVCLVLSDESLHIGPLHYQITGILGLPVLRALGRVGVTREGGIRIGGQEAPGEPNLFYDDLSMIAEIGHNGHRLQMFVDTGANESVLLPGFRDALASNELARIHRKTEKTAGAGEVTKRRVEVLPLLQLEFPGQTVELKKVSLLGETPEGVKYREGTIGMDALWDGFLFDFRTMRLDVQ